MDGMSTAQSRSTLAHAYSVAPAANRFRFFLLFFSGGPFPADTKPTRLRSRVRRRHAGPILAHWHPANHALR